MVDSFKRRTEDFVNKLNLNADDKLEIKKEIVKFALHVQEGQGSTKLRAKAYRKNVLEDVLFFKSQYLDVSHYIHRSLWKAVVGQLNYEGIPELNEDVDYCCSLLDAKELEKAKKTLANQNFNIDELDINNWRMGKTKRRDLLPHIKTKVPALNFLSKYDPALTQADFTQELACEAIKVFNMYPRSKGINAEGASCFGLQTKVEMYMEKALANKVKNLDYYYSCDSRKRVGNTNSKAIKKKKKLERHLFVELLYHTINMPSKDTYTFNIDGVDRVCKVKEKKVYDTLTNTYMNIASSPYKLDPNQKEQVLFYSDKPFSAISDNIRQSTDDAEAKELFDITYALLTGGGMDKGRAYQILKRRFVDQILDKRLLDITEKYYDDTCEKRSIRKKELILSIFEKYKDHPVMKEYIRIKHTIGTKGDYYTNVSSLSTEVDGKQRHLDVSDEDQADRGHLNASITQSNENYIWYNNLIKKVEDSKTELVLDALMGLSEDFNSYIANKHVKTGTKYCQAIIDFYQFSEADFETVKNNMVKFPGMLSQVQGTFKFNNTTNNLMEFIDVIVGSYNEDFEKWLESEKKNSSGGITVSLINNAKQYFKITKSSITNNKVFQKIVYPELQLFLRGQA